MRVRHIDRNSYFGIQRLGQRIGHNPIDHIDLAIAVVALTFRHIRVLFIERHCELRNVFNSKITKRDLNRQAKVYDKGLTRSLIQVVVQAQGFAILGNVRPRILIQATCINAVDSRNCGNVLLELLFRASGIDNIRII